MRLVRRVRPQLGIYYHQHLGITVRARGVDASLQREYARRTGLPLRSLPNYHGTAIGWQNHLIARRDGVRRRVARPGRAPVQRHVDAVLALARRVSMRIVLVRHGETEWSAAGKHTSSTDLPLTERGREAARGAARAAGGRASSRWCCARRGRARARRRALAGFEPEIDPDLVELDYGPYEGRTTQGDPRRAARLDASGRGSPGGETLADAGARADRVIARALAADGDVALFAHGHILRVLGARWIELPPGARRAADARTPRRSASSASSARPA